MKFFLIVLSLITGALVFTSCKKDLPSIENAEVDTLISLRNSPDVHTLISLHNNSKNLMQENVRLSLNAKNDVERAFKGFQIDLQNESMDDFWERHGMTQIMEAAEYFLNNESNKNVYEVLVSDFDLTTSEYEKMFLVVEVTKIVPDVIVAKIENPSDCAIAVAGYVVTVASAVAIAGPVGLGFWLAGIGFGAHDIYSNCQ